MSTERDVLFSVMAVQLGFVTADQAMAAGAAWAADRSRPIAARLRADGLGAERAILLDQLVDAAIDAHGGDAARTLATLPRATSVLASFGGGAAATAEPAPPTPPAERYLLEGGEELGRGGLGRVFVAVDRQLGREVAIKELLPPAAAEAQTASRTSAESRFLREARLAGQLEHPSIIPVYELGRRPDGELYYAMKRVRGHTLRAALDGARDLQDRLPLLSHVLDACQAIGYAHSRGVVHRDLKPDNIMLGSFGETVVLDWGLAKAKEGDDDIEPLAPPTEDLEATASGSHETVVGQALGTPAYMSPEQAEGRVADVDERSDVWGLGAILFELLTGRAPFEGRTPYEIVGQAITEAAPPVLEVAPNAPRELAAVVDKALCRDRGDRYPNAGELAEDVDAFLHGRRLAAYEYRSRDLLRRFVAQNRALSAGVLAVFVTAVVGAAAVYGQYRDAEASRIAAEAAEAEARTQATSAAHNLAVAQLGVAEQHLEGRRYDSARLFLLAAAEQGDVQDEAFRLRLESDWARAEEESVVSFEAVLDHALTQVTLSPDESTFAGYAGGEVFEHDARTLARRRAFPIGEPPAGLGYAEDGRLQAVLQNGQIVEASAKGAWSPKGTLWGFRSRSVSGSPDGRFWSGRTGQAQIQLWDRRRPDQPPLEPPLATWFFFVRSGESVLIARRDGKVVHARLPDLQPIRTYEVADEITYRAVPDPDFRRAYVTIAREIRVLDLESGEIVGRLPEEQANVHIAISRDGRYLVSGTYGYVRVWRLEDLEPVQTQPFLGDRWRGHLPLPGAARLLQVSSSRSLDRAKTRVLRLSPPRVQRIPLPPATSQVVARPSGGFVAASFQHLVVLGADGEPAAEYPADVYWLAGHERGPAVAVDPNRGQLLKVEAGGTLRRGALGVETSLLNLGMIGVSVDRVFMPNLFRSFHVYDAATLERRPDLVPPGRHDFNMLLGSAASTNGRWLVASDGSGHVYRYDLEAKRWTTLLTVPDALDTAVAVDVDDRGRILAGTARGGVLLWSEDGALLEQRRPHAAVVFLATFSPDGRWALTQARAERTVLWQTDPLQAVRTWPTAGDREPAGFTPDGRSVFVGAQPMTIRDLPGPLPDLAGAGLRRTWRERVGLGVRGVELFDPEQRPRSPSAEPRRFEGRALIVRRLSLPAALRTGRVTATMVDPERPEVRTASVALTSAPHPISEVDAGRVGFCLALPDGSVHYHFVTVGARDDVALRLYAEDAIHAVAVGAGVAYDPDRVHLILRLTWGAAEPLSRQPIGCATVETSAGEVRYEGKVTLNGGLSPNATQTPRGPGHALVFNLPVGEPQTLRVRAGESTWTVQLPAIPEPAFVWFDALVTKDQMPQNPTPPGCGVPEAP